MHRPRYLTDREHVYHSVVAGLATLVVNIIVHGDIWPRAFADGLLVAIVVYLVPALAAWVRRSAPNGARAFNGLVEEGRIGSDDPPSPG
jgi:hypothetical protein